MFNLIKSNLREILTLTLLIIAMLCGIALLGDRGIAESGPLSALVTLAVSLLGGILKFGVCLILVWFGLVITFPEAGKFVHDQAFDWFWQRTPEYYKGYIALSAAAVLGIMAALCMAS